MMATFVRTRQGYGELFSTGNRAAYFFVRGVLHFRLKKQALLFENSNAGVDILQHADIVATHG